MNRAKRLKLTKETLKTVGGGAVHRTSHRCHETFGTFCYSDCGPNWCDPTEIETCGPTCDYTCTAQTGTCHSGDTCLC